jgi:ABC-type dipeptide/oligopeptide/nickel transport system permease subunit
MQTTWRLLADAVVGVHFAFLAYVIVGGFLAWRWRWTIVTHVLACIWAALIIFVKVPCPLTALQNQFREWAGENPLRAGFIHNYVTGHLYPSGDARVVQVIVALIVLVSWVGYARRWRGTSAQRQEPTAGHRHLLRGRS